jgi:hypothetical protein
MPWHLEPGQPETEIKVVYGDDKGTYDAFANCHPGADYDDDARVVTMCYETPFDFAELYRAYVEPPPVAAVAPAPAVKKRKSR